MGTYSRGRVGSDAMDIEFDLLMFNKMSCCLALRSPVLLNSYYVRG